MPPGDFRCVGERKGERDVKALSLWQPWASLIADGRKKIETRHWPPPPSLLGQQIAIHAAKKVELSACEDFGYDAKKIPRGAIVCVVRLDSYERFQARKKKEMLDAALMRGVMEGNYGDFSEGRYGWYMSLLIRFTEPISVNGHQGIWDWSGA